MFLTKLKFYAGIILGALVAILYAMLGKEKAKREKAEDEHERAHEDIKQRDIIIDVQKEAKRIEKDNATITDDELDRRMRKYKRGG